MRRALLLVALLCAACAPQGLRRFPDRAVLWEDDDRRHVDHPPAYRRLGVGALAFTTQLAEPVDRLLAAPLDRRARNVNARGEVPDSSWFVNRLGGRARRLATPRRGEQGPSLLASWLVLRGGRDAAGPLLVIRDERRRRYLLRFDHRRWPRLATTAELIASRLLRRLGYRVPRRHLVLFEPRDLRLSTRAEWQGAGRRRAGRFGRAAFRRLVRALPRLRDGSVRAVATLLVRGEGLGPFRYRGRRSDDPNDRVPHELRRELRGLRVIASWLNLTGITDEVPRDLYLRGRTRYVVHTLWSLRGALGSSRSGRPKPVWEGFAPLFSPRRILARVFTLGGRRPACLRPLRRILVRRYPGLGWLAVRTFAPRGFRPRLTNAAFEAADDLDRHWAARLLARLRPAVIRRAVGAALLPRREARRLVYALLRRRQKILRAGLALRAPLHRFGLSDRIAPRLCFEDLWQGEGLGGPSPVRYQVRVVTDRGTGSIRSLQGRIPRICVRPVLHPPRSVRDDGYRVVQLRRPDVSSHWVSVHLRPARRGYRLVGIER